jgi:hypothetical protein
MTHKFKLITDEDEKAFERELANAIHNGWQIPANTFRFAVDRWGKYHFAILLTKDE